MTEEFQGANFSYTNFIFAGFPEIFQYRKLLFLPFFLSYILVMVGNSLMLFVIKNTKSLHSPMYMLVSALAVVDIIVPTAIVPAMLLSLLFDLNEISLVGCLIQMFFIHFFSSVESTILLAMALDRSVAICNPLRYNAIMNSSMFVKLLLFTLIRSGTIMSVLVCLAASLSFCRSNIIHHCYCDHMALVSLACNSTAKNNAMGIAVIVCFAGIDISVIFCSYVKILHVVLRAAAGEQRSKALHTCGTHLIVMMCFYFVGSVTFLSHNLSIPIPLGVNTFLGITYIVVPACINPIIYGVRTKEIQKALLKMFKIHVNRVFTVKVSTLNF
ncbi:olfactory receptor 52K1 [Electrophorus electricus]|uniref:olfactory receptor 52K1 n=1 Tax=Electrophorus electricus TaxID=8005 RepID=UPI0015D029AC|nr:olfactory receptor 52K1 [Electrophorus electricus]